MPTSYKLPPKTEAMYSHAGIRSKRVLMESCGLGPLLKNITTLSRVPKQCTNTTPSKCDQPSQMKSPSNHL